MSLRGRLTIDLLWSVLGLVVLGGLALGIAGERASAAVTLDPEELAAFNHLNLERTSRALAPAVWAVRVT